MIKTNNQFLQQMRTRVTTSVRFLLVLVVLFSTLSLSVYTYTRPGLSTRLGLKSAKAEAATSSNLNYQARLLKADGSLVPDGYYNVQFKLYASSTGGSALWSETYYDANGTTAGQDNRVRVVNGYLSVNLASQTAFPTNMNWDQDIWLTMNIGGSAQTASPTYDGEMNPRIKLTAVPYAFQAQRAEQLTKTIGSFVGQLQFSSTLAQNTVYNLVDPGIGSVDLCLSSGNCAGTGGGIVGLGTSGRVSYFTGSGTIADSYLLQSGNSILTDSGKDLNVDGGSLFVDATNNRVGIGTVTPGYNLEVAGTGIVAKFDGRVIGSDAVNNDEFVTLAQLNASGGGTNYIVNSTSNQAAANINITSVADANVTVLLKARAGQAADVLQVQDSTGTPVFGVDKAGNVVAAANTTTNGLKNNGATLNVAGSTIADHTTGGVIGTAASTVDSKTTLSIGQTTASQTLTLPNPTDTTAGRIIYVLNSGSADFTMYGVKVATGSSQSYIWNGSAWVSGNIDAGGNSISSIGTIDSQTKSANGGVINTGALYLQTADASYAGLVSTSTQTFAGAKTFNGVITAAASGTGLVVTNDATVGGTLGVTGATTLGSTLAVTGNFSVNTNKFTVDASTGNTTIAGVVTVQGTGTSVFAGSVQGAAATANNQFVTLGQANTAYAAASGSNNYIQNGTTPQTSSNFNIDGNGVIGGTFAVTGVSTFTGLATFNGGLTVANNSNFSQTGTGTFSTGTGNVSLNGNTTVTGTTSLGGNTSITGTLSVNSGATTLGGTLAVTGQTDLAASLALNKGADFSTVGTTNNAALADASLIRLTGASAQTITGIASGRDGRVLTLVNAAATAAIITNNDTNSTSANRIITGTGGSISISAGSSISLIYDAGSSLWRVTGSAASTGGAGVNTIGAINGGTYSANGASIAGTTLYLQTASATNTGLVTANTQTFGGAKTFSSQVTLSATGTGLSVANDATIGGTLGVTGDFAVNTNKFTVDAATGNTAVAGTLGSTGNFNVNTNKFTVAASSGNTAIAGTLGVTGASTFTALGTFNGGLTVANNSNFSQTGTGTFSTGTGAVTLNGNTTISGGNTFDTGSGAVSLNGATTITGSNTLSVNSGATTLGGTLAVTGQADFASSVALKKGTDYSTVGTTNNIAFASDASLIRLTGASAQTLTGIAGGRDGKLLTLVNAGTVNATIANNSVSSTAINRIITGTNNNISLPAGSSISLIYDATAGFWRVTGAAAANGGVGVNTVGTIDGGTYSANGASISGTTVYLQTATATNVGLINASTQTFGGDKTFNGEVIAAQATGTGLAVTANATIGGTLAVTGDLTINTNKFSVAAATGNTAVAGTLGVTGDFAVNTNKFTIAAATGNAAIAGTLGVTGASTFTAGATFNGGVTIASNSNFSQTGTGTFSTGSGNVTLNGNTSISGSNTFGTGTGAVSLNGATSITGTNTLNVNSGATTLGGTLSVTGQTDLTASLALKKGTDYSTVGSANNVAISDASLIRLTGASAQIITGIASGRDGRVLTLVNAGTTTATITNNDAASTAANRIITGTGSSINLPAGSSISLIYDATAGFWRVTGSVSAAGGVGVNTVGAIDGGTYSANGASIAGTTVYLQTATATNTGLINASTQTFGGAKTFNGAVTLAATGTGLSVTNDATIGGTLGVTGATTLGSTLGVTGNLSVNTNKFTVAAATGNTAVAGTLGVTGAATLSSTLGVTGDFAVNTNKFTIDAATGNTVIAGTGTITGAATLSSTVSVAGASTFNNTATVNTSNAAALKVGNSAGTTAQQNTLVADTTTGSVGIGKAPTQGALDVNGSIYASSGIFAGTQLQINNASTSNGVFVKAATAGATVASGDVLIFNTSGLVVPAATVRDTRIYGIAVTSAANAAVVSVALSGNTTVNATSGAGTAIAVGDQLVTSATSGAVQVDNSATSGIIGYATTAKSTAQTTVGVRLAIVAGQTNPNFAGAITVQGAATSVFGGSVQGADATTNNQFVTLGQANTAYAAATGSTAYIQNGTSQQASSNFNISGAGVIGTTLNVGGLATLSSLSVTNNATIGGTLGLTGDLNINTNKFNVVATSGNTTVGGTLSVVNNFAVNTSKFTVDASTGNTLVAGTLGVTGASTFTAGATFNGGVTVASNSNFSQTGTGTFSTGSGNVTLNGNTSISGSNTFGTGSGAVSLNGATSITGTNTLNVNSGATTLGGTLAVTGQANFTSSVANKRGTDFTTVGTTNDAAFTDASLIRLTGATAQTITGIAGGRDGRILTLVNAGTTTAIITNNDTNSTAINRIITGTGANINLTAGASITLVYDSGSNLWRVSGATAANGGVGVNTVGAIDGGTYSANGASISGTTVYLQTATASNVGLVNASTQTFGGDKTFNGQVVAAQATGTGLAVTANATIGGTLAVTNNFSVNTNKFTVAAATGNTAVAGTLGVTGDFAVNTNKFTIAAATGNATIAGTLDVTGVSTFTAGATFNGGVTVASNSNFSQTGTGTFSTGTGNVSLNGNTTVTGTSAVNASNAAAFKVGNSAGTTAQQNTLIVDTTVGSVGIGTAAPTSGVILSVNGSIGTNNGLQLTNTSATSGNISKYINAGTGGVNANDVVVINSSYQVVDTTTARDTRVYGVVANAGPVASGSTATVVITGNTTVNVATAANVNIGDQLVTSSVAGQAAVDNNATSGIIGYATANKAGGTGSTVGIRVAAVAGQSNPNFAGAITVQGTATSVFNGSVQGLDATANTQFVTLGQANAAYAAITGSAAYIQNGTSQQASSNFNISGAGVIGTTLSTGGLATLNSLNVTNAATIGTTLGVTGNFAVNTTKFTVDASTGNVGIAGTAAVAGATTVNTSNSAAFKVGNSAGTTAQQNTIVADTTTASVGIGKAPTLGALDVNGSIFGTSLNATGSGFNANTSSTTSGVFTKGAIAGTGGVSVNDVVIFNSSSQVTPTTTVRDTRVYGVAQATTAAASNVAVALSGNTTVNATSGAGTAIAVGDQLVTSATSGAVQVDNSATSGIVGYATTTKSTAQTTVGIRVAVTSGQTTPNFAGAITVQGTATSVFNGSVQGLDAATNTQFVTLGQANTLFGSGSYIQNTTTQQASSNFNISGAGVIGTTLNVGGVTTLGGDLNINTNKFNVVASSGNTTIAGLLTVNNATDINTTSATALQVRNGATVNLVVNNSTNQVGIGGAAANGVLTVGTGTTTAAGGIYFGTDTSLFRNGSGSLGTGALNASGVITSTSNVTAQSGNAAQVRIGAFGPSSEAALNFGSANDVNLYRANSNQLRTDNQFYANSGLYTSGTVATYGYISSASNSAAATIGTGAITGTGTGNSGNTTLQSGAIVNGGNSGVVTIQSGSVTTGTAGNVAIDTGSITTGTRGTITIGNANAGTLSLSRSGVTTAILGDGTVAGTLGISGATSIGTGSLVALKVGTTSGTTAQQNALVVDTTNTLVGIGGAPSAFGSTLQVAGSISSTGNFTLNNSSATTGGILKLTTAGASIAINNVVSLNPAGNSVLNSSVARDVKVYGVAANTQGTTGQPINVTISGNATVNVDSSVVAIGDQLVTTTTAGVVTVDNNATSGIVGVATATRSGGSPGTVGINVRPVGGQTTPNFAGAITVQGTATSVFNGSVQGLDATANTQFVTLGQANAAYAAATGSTAYIQNGTGQQTNSNFNISGAGVIGTTLSTGGLATLNSLSVTNAATIGTTLGVAGNFAVNTNKFTVNATNGDTLVAGTLTVNTATDINTTSATALQVRNGATVNLVVNNTTNQVGIGGAAANSVLTIGGDTAASTGGIHFGTEANTNLYRSNTNQLRTDAQFFGNAGIYSSNFTTFGFASGASNTTNTALQTGAISGTGTGNTGNITVGSGNNANAGNSGSVTIQSGTVTSGTAGSLTLDTGSITTGTRGTISIGGTNAGQLSLSRSTQTTAILGNGTVAGTLGITGATNITTASGTALKVGTSAGTTAQQNVLVVDTSNTLVAIGGTVSTSNASILQVTGGISTTTSLNLNTSANNAGAISKQAITDTTGVTANDVVVVTSTITGGNTYVATSSAARDTRVYGVAAATTTSGNAVTVYTAGNVTVNAVTGTAIAVGDQLVTSTTAGSVKVDNTATSGIIGYATGTKLAAGTTVSMRIAVTAGQTNPNFAGAITVQGAATTVSVFGGKVQGADATAVDQFITLGQANTGYILNGTSQQAGSNFNISNAGVIGTTLNVGGLATLNSLSVTNAASVGSTLAVGGDFTVNSTKFVVTATSGNTAIAGTLGVGDATTVNTSNTAALKIGYGAGTGIQQNTLVVDTTNVRVNIGTNAGTGYLNVGTGAQTGTATGITINGETLYRPSSGNLRTDAAFGSSSRITANSNTPNRITLGTIDGTTSTSGLAFWNDTAGAFDAYIYRSAAATLRTDAAVIIGNTGTLSVAGATTLSGTLGVTGSSTFGSGVQLTNNGATVFGTSALGNYTTDANIGTAATTVDVYTSFTINQTTAARTLSLPTPTTGTVAGRLIYVSNIGSAAFVMHTVTIQPGKAQTYIWNGTAWTATNIDGAGSGATTVGTLDAFTPKSADGGTISGNSLFLQTADNGFAGLVSTTTQTFAGDKTFNGKVTAALASGTGLAVTANATIGGTLAVGGDVNVNSGKFTVTATNGNTLVGGTLAVTSDVNVNSGKFTVTALSGNTLVGGTLAVTGGVNVNSGKFTVNATTGDTLAGGVLTVSGTGISTFSGKVQGADATAINQFVTLGQANTAYAAATGSTAYIQNGTGQQASSNFNISGAGVIGTDFTVATNKFLVNSTAGRSSFNGATTAAGLTVRSNVVTTDAALSVIQPNSASNAAALRVGNGTNDYFNISGNGAALFKAPTGGDSASFFMVQNSAQTGTTSILGADAASSRVFINKASAAYTLDVGGDTNISSGSSYRINGVALASTNLTDSANLARLNSDTANNTTNATAFVIANAGGSAVLGVDTTANLKVTTANLSVSGSSTFDVGTGASTFGGTVKVNGSNFTNNGSTVNGVGTTITNLATGGNIGSAASTVDVKTTFNISQTTTGQTLSLPNPTANAVVGRLAYVINSGSASFIMHGVTVPASGTQTYIWNGTAWLPNVGAGLTSIATLNTGGTKSVDGATISGSALVLQTADTANAGLVSIGTQTFAGDKTFNGKVTAGLSTGTGLEVTADAKVNGALTVSSGSTLNGGVTVSSGLIATGLINLNVSAAASITTIGGGTTTGQINIGNSANTTFINSPLNVQGNITQSSSSAYTFSTSTGAVSLNGATSVTGSNTLTVGTGLTSVGGGLSVTAGATQLSNTLQVGGITTLNGAQFTNNGSSVFTAAVITDKPTGGDIGSASATVDIETVFNVNQTTSGKTLTLPNPSVTTQTGRIVYVNNIGSFATFTMYGVVMTSGTSASFIWNGTAWTVTGSGVGINYVGTVNAVANSPAKSTNGAVLNGSQLVLQIADASYAGLVSTTAQTLNGIKTLNDGLVVNNTSDFNTSNVAALTVRSGSNSVLVVDTATAGGKVTLGNGATAAANGILTIGTSGTTTAAGGLAFGTDTNLFRSSAGVIRTTGSLAAGSLDTSGSTAGVFLDGNTGTNTASINVTNGNPSASAIRVYSTGEANARFNVRADGSIRWSPGTAATDTQISRSGAGEVTVQGVGTAPLSRLVVQGTTGQVSDLFRLTDGTGAVLTSFASDGKLVFGAIGTQDTNLYRTAADTLRTDDSLQVGTNLTVTGTSTLGVTDINNSNATGFKIRNGATNYFTTNTTTGFTSIGTAAPATSVLTVGTSSTTNAAGGLTFGTDTSLYRAGSNLLQTSSNFAVQVSAANAFRVQTTGSVDALNVNTSSGFTSIGSAAPANSILTVGTATTTAAGGITFGTDVNLYRGAAATLKTDDNLLIQTTTNSATAFQVQDAGTQALLTVDTTTTNKVKVGDSTGTTATSLTVFQLDSYSSANPLPTGAAYNGSMYYDTNTGRIQCYQALVWGACGAAPDIYVSLTPEYPNTVLNGPATNNVGTLTSDFCANSTALTAGNATLCPTTGDTHNFYRWTSPQTTALQEYDLYVSYKLPSTFKSFASDSTINLTARTDSLTNGAVTYEVYNSTGSGITACGTETTVTSTVNTWQTVQNNGNEQTGGAGAGCGFAANNTVIYKIRVKAKSSATVYVENLTFTYSNQ